MSTFSFYGPTFLRMATSEVNRAEEMRELAPVKKFATKKPHPFASVLLARLSTPGSVVDMREKDS